MIMCAQKQGSMKKTIDKLFKNKKVDVPIKSVPTLAQRICSMEMKMIKL